MWNTYKVNNKTPERRQWRLLVFLSLPLNIFYTFFYCFFCWLWTSKCLFEFSVFINNFEHFFVKYQQKCLRDSLQNIIEVLQCLQNCYLLAFNFTKNEFCLKYFWWNLLQISRTTLLPGTFKRLLWVKIKMFLFPGTENYLLAQKLSVFLVEFFLSPFCCIGNKYGNLVCDNLRIQSECEKMPTRKSLNMDTLYAVCFF